eukprot:scaffold412_cov116-Isochrysis_galbana.AAC.3
MGMHRRSRSRSTRRHNRVAASRLRLCDIRREGAHAGANGQQQPRSCPRFQVSVSRHCKGTKPRNRTAASAPRVGGMLTPPCWVSSAPTLPVGGASRHHDPRGPADKKKKWSGSPRAQVPTRRLASATRAAGRADVTGSHNGAAALDPCCLCPPARLLAHLGILLDLQLLELALVRVRRLLQPELLHSRGLRSDLGLGALGRLRLQASQRRLAATGEQLRGEHVEVALLYEADSSEQRLDARDRQERADLGVALLEAPELVLRRSAYDVAQHPRQQAVGLGKRADAHLAEHLQPHLELQRVGRALHRHGSVSGAGFLLSRLREYFRAQCGRLRVTVVPGSQIAARHRRETVDCCAQLSSSRQG